MIRNSNPYFKLSSDTLLITFVNGVYFSFPLPYHFLLDHGANIAPTLQLPVISFNQIIASQLYYIINKTYVMRLYGELQRDIEQRNLQTKEDHI